MMKGSTTNTAMQRKTSMTPPTPTSSSIAAYSASRSRPNEVYEDYSEVRLKPSLCHFFFFSSLPNKEQQSDLITHLFSFH
jgi:hypothetical protein